MDMQSLDERYQDAYQYKNRWLGLYKELYLYVIPNRDAFNIKWKYQDQGKPVTSQVWDDTAVLAAYERANDLHGLLMPKDRTWAKSVMDPHLFGEQDIIGLQPVMDEINNRIMFYLNQSNLARVVASSNLDLVGGTAAIHVESIDDDTPLFFRSIPAVALYIEQSTDDVLNTCWYQNNMYNRIIMHTFPKYKGKHLVRLKENPEEITQVIYGQIKIDRNRFYHYAVLQEDMFSPLWETEKEYPQILIYRDRVRPGEADGRGIGIDMLPTIIDVNRMVRDDRKNKAFKADPPMFYDNNKMFNPYSVENWAGAMIARQPNSRNPIEALQMPVYPEVMENIQMLQEKIKKGFQVDPLGEVNQPAKSATEVSIRENRAQRTSSTDISRLINEQPKQIWEVAAKILAERRLLTKDRAIGKINIEKLRFDFQSPLYDIQKQEDLERFTQDMQIRQQFFGPGASLASVNLGEASEFINDRLNLPSKLFKSGTELDRIVQTAAAQQQAQQQQGPPPIGVPTQVPFPQGVPEQF